ncbi:MAG: HNH endonuclease signature motif containing protein [Microscillaceae bacterium]|nr:HNH endonuclease signature motif containing protein [Microscillaceae bacterium]
MKNTFRALLARGVDSEKANKIVKAGYTIQNLSTCKPDELKDIGIDESDLELILSSSRPAIPDEIVDNLLYKSRRTCCICREKEKSVIIHHLIEWNKSKSHLEENLVILCLHHHDEAHTKRELSLNLTPERIKVAKKKWETEVEKHDKELLLLEFKELKVIPKKLSILKNKWFNFLQKIDMKIELLESSIYDFKIYGKRSLVLKVYEINDIKELENNDLLIREFKEDSFFDNLIILGNGPFLSNKGFYSNETNIQIGWVYSHGAGDWDLVMLKEGFDISNSIFYIENFLYPQTNYKNFLTEADYELIKEYWKQS